METLSESLVSALARHHAVALFGHSTASISEALVLGNIVTEGSPDLVVIESERLGIDESRSVGAFAAQGPVSNNRLIILVSFSRITDEAQHSLLKTLEEPSPRAAIILCAPIGLSLLPTVRSRLLVLDTEVVAGKSDGMQFAKGSLSVRRELIEPILKAKDTSQGHALLRTAATAYPIDSKSHFARVKLARLADYASDRSPSLKMLLERASLM